MTVIESSVTIAAPIEAVFDFHLDPGNLALISPSWMKTTLISESGSGMGKIIEMEVLQYNFFKSHWRVRIEEYDRPVRLTDLMLSGPMKYFCHERTLSQPCASLTELKDRLEYETPFGIIGRIADVLSVRNMMKQMFEYRHAKTKEILEERFYIAEIPAEDARRI